MSVKAKCCAEAEGGGNYSGVYFVAPSELYSNLQDEPEWIWGTGGYYEGTDGNVAVPVTRCPFCGVELPSAEEMKGAAK